MKKGILAFLWILIIFFSYKIYDSINGPIVFNEVKNERYTKVINRLKIIIKDYDKTIFVEEALHRLVEIYYYIGLVKEAKKYASILGYNYNSSEWFKQSYKINYIHQSFCMIGGNFPRNTSVYTQFGKYKELIFTYQTFDGNW